MAEPCEFYQGPILVGTLPFTEVHHPCTNSAIDLVAQLLFPIRTAELHLSLFGRARWSISRMPNIYMAEELQVVEGRYQQDMAYARAACSLYVPAPA